MADVFISYARSTEEQAQIVEAALRGAGHRVWRDAELPAHRNYTDVIEERLKTAKAVLVLWSAEAAKSQWVRAEANAGRELGTLIQASIDGTVPPIPFNQIQCADLKAWKGDENSPGWRKVRSSVDVLVGPTTETAPPQLRIRKNSICVLPFANMSGDAEQEYFSDGISEDITTDLSKVSALAVAARNTAFTFKGKAVNVGDVANALGVSHVLEGSVRKVGNRVRITAQLIDGATGDHVWADRYDRDLTDIFAIQDEISKAIVEALKVRLLPNEKEAIQSRGTTNADAYNLYLMARKYWVSGNHGDIKREQRVVRLCRRAVELDPGYGQAWALMALAQVRLYFYFGDRSTNGQAAAERALSIDPKIAEAHAVTAKILFENGNLGHANREIKKALELDPDSWEVNREAGRIALGQRRVEDAAKFYERAVSIIEWDFDSWALLVTCYQAQGYRAGVLRGAEMMHSQADKVLSEDPSNGAALGICAGGHAILGNRERAMETIERALLIDPENDHMRYYFACVLAAFLGEVEQALELLEPVMARANSTLINTATTDTDLDSLRGNLRFETMLAAAQDRLRKKSSLPADPTAP